MTQREINNTLAWGGVFLVLAVAGVILDRGLSRPVPEFHPSHFGWSELDDDGACRIGQDINDTWSPRLAYIAGVMHGACIASIRQAEQTQ